MMHSEILPVRGGRWRLGLEQCVIPVALLISAVMLGVVLKAIGPNAVDVELSQWIDSHRNGVTDAIAIVVDRLFGSIGAVVLILLISTAYAIVRRRTMAFVVAATLTTVPWLVSYAIKFVDGRARPSEAWVHPLVAAGSDPSYPSGHEAIAVSLCLFLITWAYQTRWRWMAIAGSVLLVVVVGWSRVVAGAHYPTDVAASVVIAGSVFLLVYLAWGELAKNRTGRPRRDHSASGRPEPSLTA